MFRMVPFGLLHICFKLNSLTRSSSIQSAKMIKKKKIQHRIQVGQLNEDGSWVETNVRWVLMIIQLHVKPSLAIIEETMVSSSTDWSKTLRW